MKHKRRKRHRIIIIQKRKAIARQHFKKSMADFVFLNLSAKLYVEQKNNRHRVGAR